MRYNKAGFVDGVYQLSKDAAADWGGIADSWHSDPYKAALIKELQATFERVLSTLKPQAQEAIRLYYGFDCMPHTLEAAGNVLGVGTERVRQLLAKSLRTMRHPNVSKLLRAYEYEDNLYPCAFAERTVERVSAEVVAPDEKERRKLMNKWRLRLIDLEKIKRDAFKQICDFDDAKTVLISLRMESAKEVAKHKEGSFVQQEIEKNIRRYTERIDSLCRQMERADSNLNVFVRPEIEHLTSDAFKLANLDELELRRWFKPIKERKKKEAAERKKAKAQEDKENLERHQRMLLRGWR